MPTVLHSSISSLPLIHRGKVRDLYAIDDEHMLIIATDRLSAFDVVFEQGIPDKGAILTRISSFWFARLQKIVPNHLTGIQLEDVLSDPTERAQAEGRSIIVRRFDALPIEAIVRGHISGSGWKEYQKSGHIGGIKLPEGLQQAEKLPQPIFTPSTKAQLGEHDENIDFDTCQQLLGKDIAKEVRDICLQLFITGAEYALSKGIIIADTKFELGLDRAGRVHLIDEVMTPDSSRFWPLDQYKKGMSPPSFDKQFVRDYLEKTNWNKTPPAPHLPEKVITGTRNRYMEVEKRLLAS